MVGTHILSRGEATIAQAPVVLQRDGRLAKRCETASFVRVQKTIQLEDIGTISVFVSICIHISNIKNDISKNLFSGNPSNRKQYDLHISTLEISATWGGSPT